VTVVAWDGQVRGAISVADTIKPTSREAVARLRELGLTPILLTGDNPGAARAIANQAGIEDVRAGVTPQGKLDTIRDLQAAGRVVAMVGDGVNDAAALAAADLGIAMGTGTDAAITAADLTIVSGDLMLVPDAIRLARRTLGTIKGNLFWAFAYNVAAIPVAMLALLNPILAAAAMAFSSVFVVTNSLRLRRFRPCPPRPVPAPPPPESPRPSRPNHRSRRRHTMSHDHDHSGHDHTHGHDHGGHEHGAHEHHHHEPPAGATNLVTCPVMPGNQVDPAWAEQRGLFRDYQGSRYWFCCAECGPLFDADPARYAHAA
jgi:magnesium-transporting ATPase (P-type)/YHS domain-containing protein